MSKNTKHLHITLESFTQSLKVKNYIMLSTEYVRSNIPVQTRCPNGHTWLVSWDRWRQGHMCCHCCGRNSRVTTEIVEKKLKEFNYTLIKATKAYSKEKMIVKCPKGHTYGVFWKNFASGQRCRECYAEILDIERVRAGFAKKNYKVLSTEYVNCKANLLIECPNGHHTKMSWNKFQQGGKCAECHKITIKQIQPFFEAKGYTLLSAEYKHCQSRLTARCKYGHLWETTWSSFHQGNECGKCAHEKKMQTLEHIKEYIGTYGYKLLSDVYVGVKKEIKLECPKGHAYLTCWNTFQHGCRCPICFKSQSQGECNVFKHYESHCDLLKNTKTLIKPYELDLYFSNERVAVEYCGLYWHSNAAPGNRMFPGYHRNKMNMCNKQNIRLLTIFEDEWLNHKDICISRINSALGMVKNKIFARKCIVKEISSKEARGFLARTHLQGAGKCKIAYGLFHENKLVQVMTFGSPNRAHTSKGKRVLEMKRLAGELNIVIVGGASRLFKQGLRYAKVNNYETIKSYCDLRWGTGNLYQKLGFTKTSDGQPTMHYTDFKNRYRNQCLAQNRVKTSITEAESAQQKKLSKIYDCGHQTWEHKV